MHSNSTFWKLNPEMRKSYHISRVVCLSSVTCNLALLMNPLRKIKEMQLKGDYKIYLMDDDMFYMSIFQQHLVNLGYSDISIFSDPAAYFNNLETPPDIIFYNHGVDFLKGLEVLKKIKKHNPDIYMIFICGPDDVETVIQSLKYGAFDYFIKGENDVKNIETVLSKIYRVRELLQKNNIVRFKKFHSSINKDSE